MRKLFITALFAVTACATTGGATPVDVALSNSRLNVAMSDGSNCTAGWHAEAGVARGELAGCPHALAFVIESTADRNILRQGFEKVYKFIGVYDQAVGFGTVIITDANGASYRFNSPKEIN